VPDLLDADFLTDAYIQDGASPSRGIVIAAATVGDDYDSPKNRVGVRRNGTWVSFGLSGDAVLSVDAAESGQAYVLFEHGNLVQFDWRASSNDDSLKNSRRLIKNAAPTPLGPLRCVRILGESVVCAGSVGQVYVLNGDSFLSLPTLQTDGIKPTIEEVAGTGASDILAVTSDGYVAHFDGTKWVTVDFPSNASLTSVNHLANGQYAIAGKSGTLVLGTLSAWTIVPGTAVETSYWSIAHHDDVIYAAHLGGIDEVTSVGPVAVPIANADALQFTVVKGAADGVWSFAEKTIGMIVGRQWTTIVG
jgi:hypothetical protein